MVKSIISNDWLVIIFGGLLITVLIKLGEKIYCLSKEDIKIRMANQEVMEFLEKVLISHTELSIFFLDSIISSIARKNNISPLQMNSRIETVEDAMVRIYKITYLPISERNNIVKSLIDMKLDLIDEDIENSLHETNKELKGLKKEKSLVREILPLYIAIISMLVSFLSVLFYVKRYSLVMSIRITNMLVGFLLTIGIMVIVVYSILSSVEKGKKRYKIQKVLKFKENVGDIKDKKKSKKENKVVN